MITTQLRLNQSVAWTECPPSVPYAKTKIRGISPSGSWLLVHGIHHKIHASAVKTIELDPFSWHKYSCNEWGANGIDLGTFERLEE